MPTGRPIPCEGNWVDGISHPLNRDVEPWPPFQPNGCWQAAPQRALTLSLTLTLTLTLGVEDLLQHQLDHPAVPIINHHD